MAPTFLPSGYHDSESKKFQNSLKLLLTRNLVALKLNQGSNSWMIDSYLITENTLTSVATEQIRSRMVMRIAGFHLFTGESALNIRGLYKYSKIWPGTKGKEGNNGMKCDIVVYMVIVGAGPFRL